MATTKMFKTQNDIPTATRKEMINMLNQELADMSDLYSQTKQAHWNVKGEQFISLHRLFDEFAAALTDYVDDIAERAVQLGGTAMGTNRMSAAETRLKEYPSEAMDSMEHVQQLVERYAMVAASTRAAIDTADKAEDMDTADLMTEISRGMDKWLWSKFGSQVWLSITTHQINIDIKKVSENLCHCHFDERSEEKSAPRQAKDFSLSLEMTNRKITAGLFISF
jgi:starvation-inducible DNA-binding protein